MSKNLVIVESPSKAKTIERYLGADYKVMSSYGHIRDLKKKDFGVDLESFAPQYEIPEDKKRVVGELRSAARKADAVWLASDEDREGEAIAWHLAEVLGLDKHTARRIVFHEVTKPAILAAIEQPRTIDLAMVDAQQARRVLDRLVGFKVSPVLWRRVRPNLSAGRVQSVAVRLIVEREREIEAFSAECAYRVTAVFTTAGGETLQAEYSRRFETKAEAEAFLAAVRDATFAVSEVRKAPATRQPAPPFTTSTLQQEAARKLGFPVAQTMRVAQALYEKGFITYMRTDSMNLSGLCLSASASAIESRMGREYHKRRQYHTKAKGAQEAHEAIRPTDMSREEIVGTVQEKKLYSLVWKRTIACQMADAQIEKTTVEIAAPGLDGHFTATGEVVKFDGFLRVYRESRDDDSESEEGGLLPAVAAGETLGTSQITARQRYTQQPPRYTEASLVKKLEELGIGRPSTYATVISTIQQREYVAKGENEGRERKVNVLTLGAKGGRISDRTLTETYGKDRGRLVPTDIGSVVNEFMLKAFPEIMDYNFTASVEKQFDLVAEGRENWTQMIRHFYDAFEPQVERALSEKSEHKVGERLLGTDPRSGRAVSVKIGRFGPMVQIGTADDGGEKPRFASLKKTQSLGTITLDEALELFRLPLVLGEFEGTNLVVGSGRFGPYVQHGKLFASVPKGEDPLQIDFDRAVELIREKREAEARRHLKTFEEDAELEILNGRWGPYIIYKGVNYKIPKARHAEAAAFSYADCMAIVESPEAAPKTKAASRGAKTAGKK